MQVLLIGCGGLLRRRVNIPKELDNHDRDFCRVDPKLLIWFAYVLPAVLMSVSQGSVCQAASKHLNEGISRRIGVDLRYAAGDDGKPPAADQRKVLDSWRLLTRS